MTTDDGAQALNNEDRCWCSAAKFTLKNDEKACFEFVLNYRRGRKEEEKKEAEEEKKAEQEKEKEEEEDEAEETKQDDEGGE